MFGVCRSFKYRLSRCQEGETLNVWNVSFFKSTDY